MNNTQIISVCKKLNPLDLWIKYTLLVFQVRASRTVRKAHFWTNHPVLNKQSENKAILITAHIVTWSIWKSNMKQQSLNRNLVLGKNNKRSCYLLTERAPWKLAGQPPKLVVILLEAKKTSDIIIMSFHFMLLLKWI